MERVFLLLSLFFSFFIQHLLVLMSGSGNLYNILHTSTRYPCPFHHGSHQDSPVDTQLSSFRLCTFESNAVRIERVHLETKSKSFPLPAVHPQCPPLRQSYGIHILVSQDKHLSQRIRIQHLSMSRGKPETGEQYISYLVTEMVMYPDKLKACAETNEPFAPTFHRLIVMYRVVYSALLYCHCTC